MGCKCAIGSNLLMLVSSGGGFGISCVEPWIILHKVGEHKEGLPVSVQKKVLFHLQC
jgi:hypothetical protein